MIVRVVVETFGSEKYAYISDRDRKILSEEIASEEIMEKMGGRDEAFFESETIDGGIVLLEEAPQQRW